MFGHHLAEELELLCGQLEPLTLFDDRLLELALFRADGCDLELEIGDLGSQRVLLAGCGAPFALDLVFLLGNLLQTLIGIIDTVLRLILQFLRPSPRPSKSRGAAGRGGGVGGDLQR